jgi:predicted amidophosphoribosyltransferase
MINALIAALPMTIRRSRNSHSKQLVAAALGLPKDYRLPFAACYAYSPQGCADVSERSRLMCARVKGGGTKWLEHYAARVREQVIQKQLFCDLFHPDAWLVPVPKGRATLRGCFWPARQLALAFKATGLAGTVWTGLRRVTSVERSSAAWMWERPTVQQHFQSFAVMRSVTPPPSIVLIDDVITKGRTLVAAAMSFHEAFPQTQIRAFALVRTMGLILDIERLIDPCRGEVHWNGQDAYRDP